MSVLVQVIRIFIKRHFSVSFQIRSQSATKDFFELSLPHTMLSKSSAFQISFLIIKMLSRVSEYVLSRKSICGSLHLGFNN